MLSHHMVGGEVLIQSSQRRDHNQISSTTALVNALYSTTMLDYVTVDCFLELYEMRLGLI